MPEYSITQNTLLALPDILWFMISLTRALNFFARKNEHHFNCRYFFLVGFPNYKLQKVWNMEGTKKHCFQNWLWWQATHITESIISWMPVIVVVWYKNDSLSNCLVSFPFFDSGLRNLYIFTPRKACIIWRMVNWHHFNALL